MFRKLKGRLTSAANSVMGSEDPKVQRLTALGFDAESAKNALIACNGDADRAAELLLAQGGAVHSSSSSSTRGNNSQPSNQPTPQRSTADAEDAALQRVMQESLLLAEEQRKNPPRTAAVVKAGTAAALRANGTGTGTGASSTVPPPLLTTSAALARHHPDVKIIAKLADKPREEQILRCADRMKISPAAVDTLYKALMAVQQNPDNSKFRRIDQTTAGYQRSVQGAPGAQDLLHAMNYRSTDPNILVLERSQVDPALLYLGISALEQTKETPEYKQAKRRTAFGKTLSDIQTLSDSSVTQAIRRAEFIQKCPTEPPEGRGALMQIVMADTSVRRRFDGDDQLRDVLHWLGGHGAAIFDKITSREWSLVDLNRYPVIPIDCHANQDNTLQYIGCWPSGRLEIVPSTEEWMQGAAHNGERGSSRGLGSAPHDVIF